MGSGDKTTCSRCCHLSLYIYICRHQLYDGNLISLIPCTPHYTTDDQTDRPTLMECVRFRGREKRINIPQEISVKYYKFGLLLLEDDTGAKIRSIAHKHMNDAEQINTEVLQQWITGRGKQPITWKTLAQVLHDIELNILAGEIETVKCDMDNSTEHISKDSAQNLIQDIPAEESEQRSTGHTSASGPDDEKQCKTSDELQIDVDQLAADLLARYREKNENQCRNVSHGVDSSSKGLRDVTAEVRTESDQRSNGDTPACGIQDNRFYEDIQKITGIASELPTRCSELLEASKQKDQSSYLHGASIYPPVQRCRQDNIPDVSIGSELEHIPTSGIQQIVDDAADLLSRCFELEALNLEREESQRSNATSDGLSYMNAEGSEQRKADIFASDIERTLKEIADVAADFLSRCFELLDFEASNKESGKNSVPNSVCDSPVLRGLATKDVKVSEQGSTGNIPASDSTAKDAKCHEALQHIADIAADLLYRCFVLLDFLTLQKKQTNPHEIGDRQLSSQMRS